MGDIRLLSKEEESQAVRAIGKMLKPEATNGTMPEWNILMDHLDLQRQRAEAAEGLLREFRAQLAQESTCRWCGTHTDKHNNQCLMGRADEHLAAL